MVSEIASKIAEIEKNIFWQSVRKKTIKKLTETQGLCNNIKDSHRCVSRGDKD